MASFEFLAVIVSLLGLSASITYYAMVLRNQNQTRQAQLYMDVYKSHFTKENQKDVIEMLRWNWNDYDDFEHKYGSDSNPENFAKRQNIWFFYDGIGFLHKYGLISSEMVYQIGSTTIVWQWKKFEDIIRVQREIYNLSDLYMNWEELVKYIEEMRVSHEHFAEPPETFSRYIKNESKPNT